MPRIPYAEVNDPNLDPDAAKLLAKMQPLNIFRILAHGGKCYGAYTRLASALLYKSKIDPVLREMAIVRAGVLTGSSYEVFQHEKISRDLGMVEQKLQALKIGPNDPVFSEIERIVLQLTDEIVKNTKASEVTFKAAADLFDHQELVELVMCIGFYVMTSALLENFEVEVESPEIQMQINMATKGGK